MRLLIISQTGYGLGFTHHLINEGHAVTTGTSYTSNTTIPDIAIVDTYTETETAEWLRSKGVRVLGVSQWSNLLFSDASYRHNIIKAIGYTPDDGRPKEVECIVSAWFNGQKFISKTIVFNYTKMMSGDVGIDVPSSGYVVYFDTDKSKLVKDITEPLERFLRKANHRGSFSVSVGVDASHNIYVSDISANFHEPYTQAIYENTRKGKSDILLNIFNETSDSISYIDPFVTGVLVSVYPYPYTTSESPLEVHGLNTFNQKHMWQMGTVADGVRVMCSGCVGYVIARGTTILEAQRRVYRTISNISIDTIQYRNDIGKNAGERLHKLRTLELV